MHADQPILTCKKVCKTFLSPQHSSRVLDQLDLELFPGEFVAITGPSGSGKSTLLNLIAGLDCPDEGSIQIEGELIDYNDEQQLRNLRKNQVGMIFQQFHLLPNRSVLENVLFRYRYIQAIPPDAHTRALELLDHLGLKQQTHQPARLLSGGEMQRVAIARAVVQPPHILLCDEPTGNLDQTSSIAVMDILKGLSDKGITLLLATHNTQLIPYCDRQFDLQDRKLQSGASHAS